MNLMMKMKFNDVATKENSMDNLDIKALESNFDENFKEYLRDNEAESNKIKLKGKYNIVSEEALRTIQIETLNKLKEFLSRTFGPMGSNSKIITGNDFANIDSAYSKDGLTVLKHIINSGPLETSIIKELDDITSHVEKEVGDGTTSTVILSSLIFEKLVTIKQAYNIPPFELIRLFKEVVSKIKDKILEKKSDCTLQDIYDIAFISTNGNEEVAKNIYNIYEKFGMDVDLSVGISNSSDSVVREYNGLTITEGMADPAFINNKADNTCSIPNAHIYHFVDPIDTMDMIGLFETILEKNIYIPLQNDELPVPTVITCPRLTRDMTATLKQLIEQLYQYDSAGQTSVKPPVLIITNVVASDEAIMDDIANLCGCKSIRKYIDPNIMKSDQEAGKAPTIDNVETFCGIAELVVADVKKTKFINPQHMITIDENGEKAEDPIYRRMINFLETEIEQEKASENTNSIGLLKKRLAALNGNSVDYLVGGVTIAERDATRDLVTDAVKNCKSASMYGVGYAANYEGLKASYDFYSTFDYLPFDSNIKNEIMYNIARIILLSYIDITRILYGTVCSDKNHIDRAINLSLNDNKPYNISTGSLADEPDGEKVKCSIMLDINILDTIAKIITIMVTSNQCIVQAPQLNTYE